MKYTFFTIAIFLSFCCNAQNIDKLRESQSLDDAVEVLQEGGVEIEELKQTAEFFGDDFEGFKQHFIYKILFKQDNTRLENLGLILIELQRMSIEIESLKKKIAAQSVIQKD